jgi:hypothetical protein
MEDIMQTQTTKKDLGEKIKIKVRRGYVLTIGGDSYQEGEVITTYEKQIADQRWKFELVKENRVKPEVEKESEEEEEESEIVVEKTLDKGLVTDRMLKDNETITRNRRPTSKK